MENQNNYLQHHGIKGQKWGVRKQEEVKSEKTKKELTPEEKEKRKKVLIWTGVGLMSAGAIITVVLIKRYKTQKFLKEFNALMKEEELKEAGKRYCSQTVWKNVSVPKNNLSSSRRLGIKNYMGKNRSYNIHFR